MVENNNKPILQLKDISKTYSSKTSFFGGGKEIIALNHISLEIFKGEIFGLIGESGSGKTTTGRLIVKLEKPAAGGIFLEGNEITGLTGKVLKDFRLKVQMIFQDPYQSLNPQLSIYDTVLEPLQIHKIENIQARKYLVVQALKSAGLTPPDDFLHRYPHQLSGGQRQRVAIARAMILKPKFVIADEPTSMLDASISAQIFNILLEMREKLDTTFLFISHSLAAARYLCDRIAVIYRGNLVEMGPGEEVIQKPKHPYTQALLDALPKFDYWDEVRRYDTLLKVERDASQDEGCPYFSRCKVAHQARCSRERPHLTAAGDSHSVACFYA
ncbi:MAG: dipeptide/oligopeptide/nickel ABC transporter ATP-binding protein [Desulfobulbaceae bacterium C00003063]|nr:MAG: dipeptide/oligopeptide/nickel ABC transporter ATP-binding protein [Desulfobulbaceae bacterium C00003063]